MARSKVLWCVAAIMLGTAALGLAEEDGSAKESGVDIGVTADLFSKYIWRGQNIVDDWVLQPGASVGYKGFTGSVWSNMDVTGEVVDEGKFNEVDFSLDYSNKIPGVDKLGYSLGVIHYDFVHTSFHATNELYGGLTASVPLSPGVRWYYDFDQIRGSYIQFSIGHTVEKLREWSKDGHCDLQLGVSLGYGTDGFNKGYFGVDEGAFNDLTLSAGLPICFGKLIIKPSINYSTMIDKDIRAATAKSDNFWGGVGVAFNF
jgi:hypothetical protein